MKFKSFRKNWKTTLGGLIAGIASLGVGGVTTPDGKTNWANIILATAITLLGASAKDGNVTGGTVAATPEAEKRVQ